MPTKSGNKPFSTRLPDDVRAALQTLAREKGLTESDLGRLFIIEKLAEAKAGAGSEWRALTALLTTLLAEGRTLTALTIAAQSDTIDLDQARDLVAQHLAPTQPEVTP